MKTENPFIYRLCSNIFLHPDGGDILSVRCCLYYFGIRMGEYKITQALLCLFTVSFAPVCWYDLHICFGDPLLVYSADFSIPDPYAIFHGNDQYPVEQLPCFCRKPVSYLFSAHT